MGGVIAPGTVLRQEQLSERFDVSPHAGARGAAAARGARSRLVRAEPRRARPLDLARRAPRGVPRPCRARGARDRGGDAADDGRRPRGARRGRASASADADARAARARRAAERRASRRCSSNGCRRTTPSTTSSTRVAAMPLVERLAKSARRTFIGDRVWSARSELDELYAKNDLQHRAIREAIAAGSATGARHARPRARALVGPADRDRDRVARRRRPRTGVGRVTSNRPRRTKTLWL